MVEKELMAPETSKPELGTQLSVATGVGLGWGSWLEKSWQDHAGVESCCGSVGT